MTLALIALLLFSFQQTKPFIPVEGADLKAKIDNAIADVEIQKQAVVAIGRRPKDEAVPILIRIARNHPKMPVRKTAIQMLGQTGDERAVALFRELLSK